jgi:hypothetical protein
MKPLSTEKSGDFMAVSYSVLIFNLNIHPELVSGSNKYLKDAETSSAL